MILKMILVFILILKLNKNLKTCLNFERERGSKRLISNNTDLFICD